MSDEVSDQDSNKGVNIVKYD
jgi:hypothetical protein